MGIFPKLFVAVMAHIIMENADEKIKLLIICFQLKIVDILLSFFLWASLYLVQTFGMYKLQIYFAVHCPKNVPKTEVC